MNRTQRQIMDGSYLSLIRFPKFSTSGGGPQKGFTYTKVLKSFLGRANRRLLFFLTQNVALSFAQIDADE